MTQTDISLLLADAADEVEIGTAPVQSVLRGGRRRKARRWAVATATTLVLAVSAGGTLAVTGLPGGATGNGHAAAASTASAPTTPDERHVYTPLRTQIGAGTELGQRWKVTIEVWGAPRTKAEATRQVAAMALLGLRPAIYGKDADRVGTYGNASELIGKTSHFVVRDWQGHPEKVLMFGTDASPGDLTGTDMEVASLPFADGQKDLPRLVVGQVAGTAPKVECTWHDGTSTVVVPRTVTGFRTKWFVCLASENTYYKSAKVIG
ncbi:hypothetical protein [Streptomyces mangrovisoli]|uniref:Uncharacterized protein n=1 Tax=Streptomyces mangrovisoli TaxID=1428628 RepID=A0A1J4NY14_9ACTN|nr:hypothetical protein [Streptomyces mangrovisoli]OIJ67216.1 hypothetical protein WN71_014540 [Streptomyces mangrovisoli]